MARALRVGRHVVSKHHDILDYFLVKGAPPRILPLEYGNASNPELLQLLDTQWVQIEAAFQSGAGLVLAGRVSVVAWS